MDDNVVVYGESGTGKELAARAIHDGSSRYQQPFVAVNCGAIPESLFESELFGYKKGAFTGATADKKGYLDQADGGTLFLDELGEISLMGQVKLLRAIEHGGFTPVGGAQIDVYKRQVIVFCPSSLIRQSSLTSFGEYVFRQYLYRDTMKTIRFSTRPFI